MPVDQAKLAKLQKLAANNKVGGTRRKLNKKNGGIASAEKDDTKLQAQLAKYNAVTISDVAEANFFQEDGNVLHFNRVGVQNAPQYNTTVFYGLPQVKKLDDMFPQIVPQLGPEAAQALSQLAAQLDEYEAREGKKPDDIQLVDENDVE